jgi:predicted aspartyl protease
MPDVEVRGSVDQRGSPIIRIAVVGFDDEMVAMVDTGFNGELLISENDAAAWGIAPVGIAARLELGDGSRIFARRGTASIIWMGKRCEIGVQITPAAKGSKQVDEPIALIGTRLLADDILEINFPAQTVAIRQTG